MIPNLKLDFNIAKPSARTGLLGFAFWDSTKLIVVHIPLDLTFLPLISVIVDIFS